MRKIELALASAPSSAEFYYDQGKRAKLVQDALKGKRNKSEPEFDNRGIVEFEDFDIFSAILIKLEEHVDRLKLNKDGFSKEHIDNLISHEGDHFRTAEKNGLTPRMTIRFYRMKDGSYGYSPAVFAHIPAGEEQARVLKDIIEAPDELSIFDKGMLGKVDDTDWDSKSSKPKRPKK